MELKIFSPEGETPSVICDSVILTVSDDENGKGGGLYGIRSGHAKAIIATDKGIVKASNEGKIVFEQFLNSDGFATVEKDMVRICTNKI